MDRPEAIRPDVNGLDAAGSDTTGSDTTGSNTAGPGMAGSDMADSDMAGRNKNHPGTYYLTPILLLFPGYLLDRDVCRRMPLRVARAG